MALEGSEHLMQYSATSDPASLQGFGREDVTTPFHYGSVADGTRRSLTFEQKLKKKYWKTKQAMIQKLGKDQDEYVLAGDADIDTKLEKAYHLRQSCKDLLQILEKYTARLRELSSQELAMGDYLNGFGESEFTSAGVVMQSVGQVQETNAKARMITVPPLMRMQHEFATFVASAIKDLDQSIHTLEKARTEYRAALLWMKNVSEKLHNPDYRDQLARFREAQAAVKETKARFEKMKVDLAEKIDMVTASRCNLLSRSLPTYQKEVLDFTDKSANEFHRMLVDLRGHHHHQYKVKKVLQEIRDLEQDEAPVAALSSSPVPSSDSSTGDLEPSGKFPNDDEPLIDVGADLFDDPPAKEVAPEEGGGGGEGGGGEEEEAVKEEEVKGSGATRGRLFTGSAGLAAIRELQSEMLQTTSNLPAPAGSAAATTVAGGDAADLLQLEPNEPETSLALDATLVDVGGGGEVRSEGVKGDGDHLFDEWSSFSQFIGAEQSSEPPPLDWEKLSEMGPPHDPLLDFGPLEQATPPAQPRPLDTDARKPKGGVASSKKPRGAQFDELFALALKGHTSADGKTTKGKAASAKSSGGEEEGGGLEKSTPAPLGAGTGGLGELPAPQGAGAGDLGKTPAPLGAEAGSLGELFSAPPVSQTNTSSTDEFLSVQRSKVTNAPGAADLQSLDPLFQASTCHTSLQPVPSAPAPVPRTNSPPFRPPLAASQIPILPPAKPGLTPMLNLVDGGGAFPQPQQPGAARSKVKEEGPSWMNVFADLDPLNNEKV